MENSMKFVDQKLSVKASELLRKFKTKEDRFNFLREISK